MSKAEWVVAGGSPGEVAYCERCGEGLRLNMPQPIPIFVAASKAFVKIHSACKPGGYFAKPTVTPEEWLQGRDTGISSLTIYAVMTDTIAKSGWYDTPSDPSDFGRCYRLLKLFPKWKERLPEVASKFPKWKRLVAEWDSLQAMYEQAEATGWKPPYTMYERMKAIGL